MGAGSGGAASARGAWSGLALAVGGSMAFSGKAIIVKLAYRYGVDAVTLIIYRMLFALPSRAAPLRSDGAGLAGDLAVRAELVLAGIWLLARTREVAVGVAVRVAVRVAVGVDVRVAVAVAVALPPYASSSQSE